VDRAGSGKALVTIEFKAVGRGTELRFRHERFLLEARSASDPRR